MCDIRGCKQAGTRIYITSVERWVKKNKENYIKSFPIKRVICATCFSKIVNNRQGGDKRMMLGGY